MPLTPRSTLSARGFSSPITTRRCFPGCADHLGATFVYYLDVAFDQTGRRHAMRPQAGQFTREQMRGWLDPDDRPAITGETVIPRRRP